MPSRRIAYLRESTRLHSDATGHGSALRVGPPYSTSCRDPLELPHAALPTQIGQTWPGSRQKWSGVDERYGLCGQSHPEIDQVWAESGSSLAEVGGRKQSNTIEVGGQLCPKVGTRSTNIGHFGFAHGPYVVDSGPTPPSFRIGPDLVEVGPRSAESGPRPGPSFADFGPTVVEGSHLVSIPGKCWSSPGQVWPMPGQVWSTSRRLWLTSGPTFGPMCQAPTFGRCWGRTFGAQTSRAEPANIGPVCRELSRDRPNSTNVGPNRRNLAPNLDQVCGPAADKLGPSRDEEREFFLVEVDRSGRVRGRAGALGGLRGCVARGRCDPRRGLDGVARACMARRHLELALAGAPNGSRGAHAQNLADQQLQLQQVLHRRRVVGHLRRVWPQGDEQRAHPVPEVDAELLPTQALRCRRPGRGRRWQREDELTREMPGTCSLRALEAHPANQVKSCACMHKRSMLISVPFSHAAHVPTCGFIAAKFDPFWAVCFPESAESGQNSPSLGQIRTNSSPLKPDPRFRQLWADVGQSRTNFGQHRGQKSVEIGQCLATIGRSWGEMGSHFRSRLAEVGRALPGVG